MILTVTRRLDMTFAALKCASLTTSKLLSMALTFSLLLLTGCAGSVIPIKNVVPQNKPLVDHSITGTWNQSTVNNGFCSSTVTTSCISGFNEGYLQGTTQVQLHNDTTAVCSGTTQPLNCASTFNGILPIGSITFYVVTTYVDQNGLAGVTAAALSAPVPVGADPATNVNFSVK